MTSHLTILTGASRGLGLAMAQQLLDAGHQLLCISRHANTTLAAHAQASSALTQWTHDLTDSVPLAARLAGWLAALEPAQLRSATLINNAGVIAPIAPLQGFAPDEMPALAQALRVDLEAPMLLSAAFLRATAGWSVPRRVLNISSGLGRRAMASQAGYCAAKAGMDHFTRCLALEQQSVPNGARVCSLAPGVIDTEMQVTLRSADSARFADAVNFAALKSRGMLASAEQAARAVLAYLERPDFGEQPVADVRG
ncbi:MAG: SDR family NAD(P)-dependent oxidoreductase [Betaproteobacteria bacterium]|nr:SDR family NAD(P)-dependent oxidoreductase [Betaproteobacteria bacterium]